jgi:hypothetical protein
MAKWFTPQPLPTEHLTMSGIELIVIHSLKTIILIDQTGADNDFAMAELAVHWKQQGYFLHGVTVVPDKGTENKEV